MKNSNLVLEVKNVSKFYKKDRKQKITVLEHINLEVKENEIVALLGRSGSGKSTLLRMAAGLVEPDLGTIVLRFACQRSRQKYQHGLSVICVIPLVKCF